ncbi:CAAS1 protein, partial [Polypterus senegalus]
MAARLWLPPVPVPLEVKPQLKDAVCKLAAEAMPVGVFPLPVDYLERNVLVGRPGVETQNCKVFVICTRLQEVLRSGALVDEVRVEDVELVALHDLGGRVVKIIMGLIVFVPFKPRVDTIKKARLAWPVFVCPQVDLPREGHLHAELGLVSSHSFLGPAHKGIFSTLAGVACHLQLLASQL